MHKINGIYSAALTPINDDLSINKNLYLEHCQYLMKQGHEVICADVKPLEYWFQIFEKNKDDSFLFEA